MNKRATATAASVCKSSCRNEYKQIGITARIINLLDFILRRKEQKQNNFTILMRSCRSLSMLNYDNFYT